MELLSVITFLLAFAVIFKLLFKLSLKQNGSYRCLVGKTAIVTGANTGIGYITALDFAKRGARVILACRNKDRAEEAEWKIKKASGNPNVTYKLIDLTSFQSVRDFAKDINETESRLDILVNNAAAGGLGNNASCDGLQITMQVNYFSPFLLTHLLLDKLKKSAPSRIVNVASVAAKYSKFDLSKINEFPSDVTGTRADVRLYCNTKLCNILFTTEMAKKIEGSGVTVNALHPGVIYTELYRRLPEVLKVVVVAMLKLLFKSSEEGAQTTIYVSVSEELEGVSGKLFDNCKEIELYSVCQDAELSRQLWEKSETLCNLSKIERI